LGGSDLRSTRFLQNAGRKTQGAYALFALWTTLLSKDRLSYSRI
jgi:hypothetical protein